METNSNKNLLPAILVSLLIGLLGGYYYAKPSQSSMTHVMPDGTVMNNTMDMASMMGDMNASLIGKSGDEFDKEFLKQMIVHHQGAVDMAKMVLVSAKHNELKSLAKNIIESQSKEINDMKNWSLNWYNIKN
jgi:uncharacterized protein (DUF305 family)